MSNKIVMVLLQLLFVITMSAENYFRTGTVWTEVSQNTPNDDVFTRYEGLGEEIEFEGEMVMPLCLIYDGVMQSDKVLAYVKTEGDKVFVRSPKKELPKWYLLYDFGLQVGEGTYIESPYPDFKPENILRSYMVCTDRGNNTANQSGHWEYMTLAEYESDDLELPEGLPKPYTGKWVIGVGGLGTLLLSNGFDLCGVEVWLAEATNNGEILFKNSQYPGSNIEEIFQNEISISSEKDGIYDLTGKYVAKSSEGVLPGVYISVKDSKASKILIRK